MITTVSSLQHKAESLLVTHGPTWTQPLIALMPFSFKRHIGEAFLSRFLKTQLQEGELAFLEGKQLALNVTDIALTLSIGLHQGRWVIAPQSGNEAVKFSADSQSLLLIASGHACPDTLFFKRKLMISGDTELGLEIKNLFLSLDSDDIPRAWNQALSFGAQMVLRHQ